MKPQQMLKLLMETKRLRSLGIEIFKTLNNVNAGYMKEIFNKLRNGCSERLNNLENKKYNGVRYGRNSLRVLRSILWNSLPPEVRKFSSLKICKNYMKQWGGTNYSDLERFKTYFDSIK